MSRSGCAYNGLLDAILAAEHEKPPPRSETNFWTSII